jgi:hypothetical protein
MDRETLRKQLYEELYLQFDAKLQEAKRQKSQLEEEMEASSEKWRAERRRLHSEIDKLETKLVETREVRRKAPGTSAGRMVDAQELAKVKAEAEESLKRATEDFEADRARLQAEISRLQSGIAELIERSNNPLRAGQLEKEKFEAKLDDTLRAKRQAEDSLLAAKSDWEEEKLKLSTELAQLRRSTLQVKSLKTKQDEEHAERLERQLQELIRLRDGLSADLEKARNETTKSKQSHAEDRERLAAQLDSSKKEISGLEKQLRDATVAREKLERETDRVREVAASMKSGQSESTARLKEELEDARAEAKAAARRVDEAKSAAAKERAGLEKQVRDSAMAQEKLERELDQLRQAPASFKESHAAEMTRLKEELDAARSETKRAEARLDESRTAALKERASLEKQLREASHSHQKPDREQDKPWPTPETLKDAHATEVSRLKGELDAARSEAKIAEARLGEFKIAGSRLRAGLEKQLQDAAQTQEKLLRELEKFKQAPDGRIEDPSLAEAARAEARAATAASKEHVATIDRLNRELGQAREAIKQLQSDRDNAAEKMNSEIVEQLRRQYEARMQELIQQKTELTNQLRAATSALEEERIKLESSANSASHNGSGSLDVQIINAEVARVQGVIAGITQLMNDPETELSTVIRKNVERAELDAYLKGILFSLGRSSGQ